MRIKPSVCQVRTLAADFESIVQGTLDMTIKRKLNSITESRDYFSYDTAEV